MAHHHSPPVTTDRRLPTSRLALDMCGHAADLRGKLSGLADSAAAQTAKQAAVRTKQAEEGWREQAAVVAEKQDAIGVLTAQVERLTSELLRVESALEHENIRRTASDRAAALATEALTTKSQEVSAQACRKVAGRTAQCSGPQLLSTHICGVPMHGQTAPYGCRSLHAASTRLAHTRRVCLSRRYHPVATALPASQN